MSEGLITLPVLSTTFRLISLPSIQLLNCPEALGFRNSTRGGPHSSRTIMLHDLRVLLEEIPQPAHKKDYLHAIFEDNILGKKTVSSRKKSAEYLGVQYGLDPSITIFRSMRYFWHKDACSQPLLAMLCALARDPVLRLSVELILQTPVGERITKYHFEQVIEKNAGDRFSHKTLESISRNVFSSWTQAGYLKGNRSRYRTLPDVTVGSVAYAVLLGYLCGERGKLLLDCIWVRLLGISTAQVLDYVLKASRLGWLDYRGIDSVVEIRFPNLLTQAEQRWLDEQD